MVRDGFTKKGTQRWKCLLCRKTRCWIRKDVSKRNIKRTVNGWLIGFDSLTKIAKTKRVHRTTLSRKFSEAFDDKNEIKLPELKHKLIIVVDGKGISKKNIALIIFDIVSNQPILWSFTPKECFESWFEILKTIRNNYEVSGIVSDGQKGLKKAIKILFPNVPHQRCISHIVRFTLSKLTQRPRTEAGRLLRSLVLKLKNVKDKYQTKVWKRYFLWWDKYYDKFLREKSENILTKRKWFVHKSLRASRSHIFRALSNMFFYIDNPAIPNTTNHVEGGINSELSELLRRHRGITEKQKEALVSRFLENKRKKKSSQQNAT